MLNSLCLFMFLYKFWDLAIPISSLVLSCLVPVCIFNLSFRNTKIVHQMFYINRVSLTSETSRGKSCWKHYSS